MIVKTKKLEIKRQRRPTWEEHNMEIVDTEARMSVCKFYHIGCAFVTPDNKDVLVTGYNGPASGEPHCIDVGCAKLDGNGKMLPPGSGKCRGCHAEMNGMAFAADRGIAIGGTIIYCTFSPCRECAKHLIRLRPIRFIYKFRYEENWEEVNGLFRRRGIELRKFEGGGNNGQK